MNGIIDWFQATFPPNRIVVLLGGILTAVSGAIAAWLAAHFPGLQLGAAEIAGIMAAALLISIRLLDRWIDQWQRGESIDAAADVEAAFDELGDSPEMEALISALGSLEVVSEAITALRERVEKETETLTPLEITEALEAIAKTAAGPLPAAELDEPAAEPAINAAAEEEPPAHHPA
jgi:hypothetical protein